MAGKILLLNLICFLTCINMAECKKNEMRAEVPSTKYYETSFWGTAKNAHCKSRAAKSEHIANMLLKLIKTTSIRLFHTKIKCD